MESDGLAFLCYVLNPIIYKMINTTISSLHAGVGQQQQQQIKSNKRIAHSWTGRYVVSCVFLPLLNPFISSIFFFNALNEYMKLYLFVLRKA